MTALVLIPGLMNDEWVWSFVRPALEKRLPVHVPYLLGHDSLVQMASMILAETSGPLAVAGHSMGGRVAMEVERVRLQGPRIGKEAGPDLDQEDERVEPQRNP